jgi:hypothetical protein
MEHRDTSMRNWFLPAAVAAGLYTVMTLAMTVLWPGGAVGVFSSLVCVVRDGLLTALLIQAARDYGAKVR